jgi:GNAT superfamily N-acetyltransferase
MALFYIFAAMTDKHDIMIRLADKKDVPAMLSLIQELALYEKAPSEVENTVEKMEEDGFGKNPVFKAFVAEVGGEVAGLAIFYIAYSTWKGKSVYLDDLVVTENYRRYGIGKKLFDAVGAFAKSIDANQLRWHVLDWNEPAINFYKKYNASLDPQWITCKFTREQIGLLFN